MGVELGLDRMRFKLISSTLPPLPKPPSRFHSLSVSIPLSINRENIMMLKPKISVCPLPVQINPLDAAVKLLAKYREYSPYYAYEREGVWHIGLSSHASLEINCNGERVVYHRAEDDRYEWKGRKGKLKRKRS